MNVALLKVVRNILRYMYAKMYVEAFHKKSFNKVMKIKQKFYQNNTSPNIENFLHEFPLSHLNSYTVKKPKPPGKIKLKLLPT